jgi:kumamolisin
MVVLPVAAAHLPVGAHLLGPLPGSYPLRLVVGLVLPGRALLDSFLRQRTRPGSPLYRRTLTPAQLADTFGVTAVEQDHLIAYLRSHGLRVMRTYANRLMLDVAGDAAHVSRAFGVTLVRYRDRQGRQHYVNTTAPRLPANLAGLVQTVVGLRNDLRIWRAPLKGARATGLGPRGAPSSPLTPAQVRGAYDITPLYTDALSGTVGLSETVPVTGAGQTVAIYELSPFDPADIASYDAHYGLAGTVPISSVAVQGGADDAFGNAGRLEAALDIELVQAIAPGAHIVVYSGSASPTSSDLTVADDTYARAVQDNVAQVLTTSWGQCEQEQAQSTDTINGVTSPDLPLLQSLFAQAAAQGMTVLAASGDSGASDCLESQFNPSVDYPASDQNVIGVGGTVLSADASGNRIDETAWSGSGGGASTLFARPGWQVGLGLPGPISQTMRLVPDVASDAGTNYSILLSGSLQSAAGTSAGPPFWAGLLALVNQARTVRALLQQNAPPGSCVAPAGLGNILPDLYRLDGSQAFHDITSGRGNGYGAPGAGWDAVTGLGSPDAFNLTQQLLAMSDLAPQVVPCTATPTPTATSTPMATNTALPTATASVTQMPTATATGTATSAPTAKVTAVPPATATSAAIATGTSPPTATALPTTAVPSARATSAPSATATITVAPTATPTRVANTPTSTPSCYFDVGTANGKRTIAQGAAQTLIVASAQGGASVTANILPRSDYPARAALFNRAGKTFTSLLGTPRRSGYSFTFTTERHSGIAVLVYLTPLNAPRGIVTVQMSTRLGCSGHVLRRASLTYRVAARPATIGGHGRPVPPKNRQSHGAGGVVPSSYALSARRVRAIGGSAMLSIRGASGGRPVLIIVGHPRLAHLP